MNRERIAKRLLSIARQLIAVDPDVVYDELKSIEIDRAEGNIETGLPTLEGKKFTTVPALARAIERFPYPDGGYDKCNILITLKDGSRLKNFRYDHGERDPSFVEQLEWYLKNRVNISE